MPTFVAFLAAIMLVIAGAPSRAAASPCNPCPPDCAMMKQMTVSGGEHDKAPAKGDNPCKQGLACQVSASMTAPAQCAATVTLASAAVNHHLGDPLAAPSRPPDRSLRPPIQL